MVKENKTEMLTDSAVIEAALIRIYEPLKDEPLPDTHTGPEPKWHNMTLNIAIQAIVGAVHKREIGAKEFCAKAEASFLEREETDKDHKDIRTVNASTLRAKAHAALTAAMQMKAAFDGAYEELTGKVFDHDEWVASFDSSTPNADLADRRAKADEAMKRTMKLRKQITG